MNWQTVYSVTYNGWWQTESYEDGDLHVVTVMVQYDQVSDETLGGYRVLINGEEHPGRFHEQRARDEVTAILFRAIEGEF